MNQKDIHKLKTIYTTILESKEDGGPPYIKVDSRDKFYYKDKEMTILHREDGPATEYTAGGKAWYINGKLHREDGPAIEWANGWKSWYINGERLTEKEFKAYFANKAYKASHDTTTDFEAFD